MKKYKKRKCRICGLEMSRGERELSFEPYFFCSYCGRYFDLRGEKEYTLEEIMKLKN